MLDALSAILYIVALAHIPLPTIVTILQASPVIIVAVSGLFLGEQVGWRRWLAVGVGFAGVVLVVRPGASALDLYLWLALLTPLVMTARDVITRHIRSDIPSAIVTLVTTAFVGAAGFIGAAVQPWNALDTTNALYLLGAAFLIAAGNHTLIRAMRLGQISVVAPYRYSAIVWAMTLGVMIWGDVPDAFAFAGTALIVAAGVYTFHREARLRATTAQSARPENP